MKILILISFLAFSAAAATTCLEIPESQLQSWQNIKPKTPSLAFLFMAKKLIDNEKDFASNLGSDKTAHCYLGCRIIEETDIETAKYVAWQKEYNDATDCDRTTRFDVNDYNATLNGARLGMQIGHSCVNQCQKEFSEISAESKPKHY